MVGVPPPIQSFTYADILVLIIRRWWRQLWRSVLFISRYHVCTNSNQFKVTMVVIPQRSLHSVLIIYNFSILGRGGGGGGGGRGGYSSGGYGGGGGGV